MGDIHTPLYVKPICGVTFVQTIELNHVLSSLEDFLGSIEEKSAIFNFSFTQYYQNEMGSDLKKIFLSFVRLIDPIALPGIKIRTNAIEKEWLLDNQRKINLDPGYITGAKVVLASTKDFAHRIYLGDGIYGDNHLRFIHGRFISHPWTYPDYQTDLALDFFTKARASLME